MSKYEKYYDFVKKEWEVEEIKGNRVNKIKNPKTSKFELKKEYLIKWKGFIKTTWEPEENLGNCPELLQEYLKKINSNDQYNETSANNNIDSQEEEKSNGLNITLEEFYKLASNKTNIKDKDKIKILEVIGVRFPIRRNNKIIYKVKYRFKGKKEIKMIENERNIIPNNKIVSFYEKVFGDIYKGQYYGN